VNNGAISELPVSDRVRDAEAGDHAAAAGGEASGGGLARPLPHAVRAQAVRTMAAAAAAVTAIARLPARVLPKGGCASPVSNDTLPSPVFDRHAVSKVLAPTPIVMQLR